MTIRLGGMIFGLAITAVLVLWSLIPGVYNYIAGPAPEKQASYAFYEKPVKPAGGFAFDGAMGKWDVAQLQRGYQVYKEVCSACHSLKFVAFRNLRDLGYTEAEVQAEAASWTVPGLDPATGEATTRPGTPTDRFPSPYPNAIAAAAANNNAIPPDLSLMAKARPDGTNYIYSLMVGYTAAGARWPGDLCRRQGSHHPADGRRRCRLPDLDCRAFAGPAQADRLVRARLPAVRDVAGLPVLQADLGRDEAEEGISPGPSVWSQRRPVIPCGWRGALLWCAP